MTQPPKPIILEQILESHPLDLAHLQKMGAQALYNPNKESREEAIDEIRGYYSNVKIGFVLSDQIILHLQSKGYDPITIIVGKIPEGYKVKEVYPFDLLSEGESLTALDPQELYGRFTQDPNSRP